MRSVRFRSAFGNHQFRSYSLHALPVDQTLENLFLTRGKPMRQRGVPHPLRCQGFAFEVRGQSAGLQESDTPLGFQPSVLEKQERSRHCSQCQQGHDVRACGAGRTRGSMHSAVRRASPASFEPMLAASSMEKSHTADMPNRLAMSQSDVSTKK